ncbi:phage protein [Clostridium tetani]|uniref:hypothetical protein n=1 Tax=Clostridium tetani TaxID=1513 RepID=UPI000573DACD|nr:hypothetical protein [Clostridium tetani]KHO32080.1 phage protein [Clostridium tetani]RXI69220.1 hypothetical protein DQN76_08010 [Clostridium tetani]
MNNLENSIKDCITKEIEKGIIEKVIAEQLEKCIEKSISDMFSWGGDVKKVVEEKVKSVMIPHLENYDYSQYIVKLDSVLTNVLKSSTLENRNLLENFKELIVPEEREVLKVSELFNIWTEFVAKNVDTADLEVNFDDDISYESVEVSMEVEYEEERTWSSFENAKLVFECEQDEKMNFEIRLSRRKELKGKSWDICYRTSHQIESLRHLNKFEILLMKLAQNYTELELDTDYENDEITPNEEPEASFS